MPKSFVFLHGFTGDSSAFRDVRLELGEPRSLAPNLAGHDGSEASAGTFEEEVDRIADGVVSGGFVGAHLCGYSLGGRVALGLLVRHPQLFSSATLIGAHPGLRTADERRSRAVDDQRWVDRLLHEGVPSFVEAWEGQPLWNTQASMPADVVEAQRRIRLQHSAKGLASALRVLGLSSMPDYNAALASIGVSVTLIAGERDTKFVDVAQRMALAMTSARVVVMPGAGHNVLLERPRELAAILRPHASDPPA